jgi:hypothetical protein
LSVTENQGQRLSGRWVNSHDLRAGDVIFDRDGHEQRVLRVSQVYDENARVCNLMIEEHQNYAVGMAGILVHNISYCGHSLSETLDMLGDVTDDSARLAELERVILGNSNLPRRHLDELVDAFHARFGNLTLSQAAQAGLDAAPGNFGHLVEELGLHPDLQRALLRDATGQAGSGRIAHHLIPLEAQTQFADLMQKGAWGGFNVNGIGNGRLLLAVDHIGGHPRYNKVVLDRLRDLDRESRRFKLSDADVAEGLQDIADMMDEAITSNLFGPWG